MFPTLLFDNTHDLSFGHTKFFCEGPKAMFPVAVSAPDSSHVRFREFSIGTLFAFLSRRETLSSLSNLIQHIVSSCAKKQMFRIHATAVIATVKDAESFFNSSFMKNITQAMCQKQRTRSPSKSETTISDRHDRSIPYPTRHGFTDTFIEHLTNVWILFFHRRKHTTAPIVLKSMLLNVFFIPKPTAQV